MKKQLAEQASRFLKSQILVGAQGENERFENRLLDNFSLGYIFGFSFGAFDGMEEMTYDQKLIEVSQIYARVFGEQGDLIFQDSLDLIKDADFRAAGFQGWMDINEAQHSNDNPSGLICHLIGKPNLEINVH